MNYFNKFKYKCQKVGLIRDAYFVIRFLVRNRYIPNFSKPITFNEKINNRKANCSSELMALCSDKIKVKDYVANKISDDIIIENYLVVEKLTECMLKKVLDEKGDCLVKANHNSGPVHLVEKGASNTEITNVCKSVNEQLEKDFGIIQNEKWYSKIDRKILIEKRIFSGQKGQDLKDYKFHVFKKIDGSFHIVLHIDYDRSKCHNRSFFTESLEWLPFSMGYPCLRSNIEVPENYEKMLEIVKVLAEPFSYVRVDLYNVSGKIYFGEMTFAHGSGLEQFSQKYYDNWMGSLWHQTD